MKCLNCRNGLLKEDDNGVSCSKDHCVKRLTLQKLMPLGTDIEKGSLVF